MEGIVEPKLDTDLFSFLSSFLVMLIITSWNRIYILDFDFVVVIMYVP